MSNTRRYMDFAPRRNVARRVPSGTRSRTVSASSSGEQDDVDAVRVVRQRNVGPKIGEVSTSVRRRKPVQKDVNYVAFTRQYTKQSGANQDSDERLTRNAALESLAQISDDYWDEDLGVIEDIEGLEEPEKLESFGQLEMGVDEGYSWAAEKMEIEAPRRKVVREKGKDNRVGFKQGKSPFINTEKLEKRPLSAFRYGKGPMPAKNSYADQVKAAEENDDVPTMVVTGAGKGSSLSLAIIIILVTILGAAVGFVVYLAFFQ